MHQNTPFRYKKINNVLCRRHCASPDLYASGRRSLRRLHAPSMVAPLVTCQSKLVTCQSWTSLSETFPRLLRLVYGKFWGKSLTSRRSSCNGMCPLANIIDAPPQQFCFFTGCLATLTGPSQPSLPEIVK